MSGTKTKERVFTDKEQRLMFELVQRARRVLCVRLQVNPNAPTCRSPVKGEGLPRRNWCLIEGPVS